MPRHATRIVRTRLSRAQAGARSRGTGQAARSQLHLALSQPLEECVKRSSNDSAEDQFDGRDAGLSICCFDRSSSRRREASPDGPGGDEAVRHEVADAAATSPRPVRGGARPIAADGTVDGGLHFARRADSRERPSPGAARRQADDCLARARLACPGPGPRARSTWRGESRRRCRVRGGSRRSGR
jgi:hypothetical protein